MKFVETPRHYVYLSLAVSTLISFLMVFLQPYDTPKDMEIVMSIKLAGYGVIVFISMLLSYVIERKWYLNSGKKWDIQNELSAMFILFLLIATFTNIYHAMTFRAENKTIIEFGLFIIKFVLPFTIVVFPIIFIVRQHFGLDHVSTQSTSAESSEPNAQSEVQLMGENSGETLIFTMSEFCFAMAQQNYVAINLINAQGQLQETLIRTTLTDVEKQVPNAIRVHRSYLINPSLVEHVSGPKRKTQLKMRHVDQPIPVSASHLDTLKNAMQIHPK